LLLTVLDTEQRHCFRPATVWISTRLLSVTC